MTDVLRLAADLGLEVSEHEGQRCSGYRPNDNSIHLTAGMRGRVLRSVLAHEIAHHVLGHRPTDSLPSRMRQETAANLWAARILITPDLYAEAERAREGHVPSMAFDLNVSDELVVAFQRQLLRTDTAVYVAPRMGAGQFTHRCAVT